ncbi:MAG: hypothetical protein KDC76_09965 [Bacteroidetes bacterium]|nr:hypothetical protein [Bacteroidota bacterium]
MTEQTNSSRFKLDGSIEAKKESKYLLEAARADLVKQRRVSRSIIGLLLLSLLAMGYVVFSLQAERNVVPTEELSTDNQFVVDSLNQLMGTLNDSLIKLHLENDLLTENYGGDQGVYFHVCISGFSKFNLSKYNQDMDRARRLPYDGRTYYSLIRFKSFQRALLFESDLKQIGMETVEIVGAIDGKFVPYREALDALHEEK